MWEGADSEPRPRVEMEMTLNGGGERGGGWRSRVLCGDKTNVCLHRAALRQATCLVSLFVPARLSQREAKRQPSPYLLNGRVAFSPSCPTDSTTQLFQVVVRVKLTRLSCVDTLQSLRFVNLVLSPLKEKQTENSFSSNNTSFQSFGVF